ncbi:MAG TPA: hypothetical protein VK549_11355, partial [Acidimicrobiia bacterium]|nr:hypothetical protein [Acidimicrobiia bacterium]
MKTFERVRVVAPRKLSRLRRFEVGPHGDLKAVTLDDACFDAWIESSDRAVCLLREASRELDFSRCTEPPDRRNSGDDVARSRRETSRLELLRTTASS